MTLLTTKQYKLDLSQGLGFLTGGITLSPSTEAGRVLGRNDLRTMCANSGECEFGCLAFTGMLTFPTHILARARRTAEWIDNPRAFVERAVSEYRALIRKAERLGFTPAGRPNLLSDQPTLAHAISDALPMLQLYDYTKLRHAHLRVRPMYHLTYSASERSTRADIHEALDHGINVAIVFSDVAKGEPLPRTYSIAGRTLPVIDGDLHDLRFKDPVPVIVGLRWKGSRARKDAAVAGAWALPTIPLTVVS